MHNFQYFIYSVSLFAFLMIVCTACNKSKNDVLDDADILKVGDVVFRLGDSSESNAILVADPGADYSHVGIVVNYDGKTMIIHACPSEKFEIDENNTLKMESPEIFFDNKNCLQGAIYRFADRTVASKAAETAIGLYDGHFPFDYNFDASDSSAFYCTEFIEFSYNKAGISLTDGKTHNIDIPGAFIPNCILVSDIQKSDKLELISSF